MKQNRERLTWAILLASFFIFVSLLVAIPFGTRAIVERATRPLVVQATVTNGTPIELISRELIDDSGAPQRYRTPTGMETRFSDRGVYQVVNPDTNEMLARVEVADNTSMRINRATMPRFGRSSAEPYLSLTLNRGRARIIIPDKEGDDFPVVTHVMVGDNLTTIVTPGRYAVDAQNGELQFSVLEGNGAVQGNGEELFVQAGWRGVVAASGETLGLFEAERELIRNGTFQEGLNAWNPARWTTEQDPTGKTEVINSNGEAVLHFERVGIGNARTDVSQRVEKSVADFSILELAITMRVIDQSLPVCGGLGTECPMTVRLDYVDNNGQVWPWEQGFFASGQVNEATAPDYCKGACGFPLANYVHEQVSQMGEVYVYQSPNLMTLLGGLGIRPNYIQSITLTAEGHSFNVEVISVSLIARDTETPVAGQ